MIQEHRANFHTLGMRRLRKGIHVKGPSVPGCGCSTPKTHEQLAAVAAPGTAIGPTGSTQSMYGAGIKDTDVGLNKSLAGLGESDGGHEGERREPYIGPWKY